MARLFTPKESSLSGWKRMKIKLIGMKMLSLGGIIKKMKRNNY